MPLPYVTLEIFYWVYLFFYHGLMIQIVGTGGDHRVLDLGASLLITTSLQAMGLTQPKRLT